MYATIIGYLVALALFPAMRTSWPRFVAAIIGSIVLAALLTWALPIGLGVGRLGDLSSTGRIGLWLFTLPQIEARPLFGWGEDQLRILLPPNGVVHLHNIVLQVPSGVVQPHNIVLQVLLAWGAIGAMLMAGLAAWSALGVLKRSDEADFPFTLALLMVSAFSFFDGALFHVQSVATFALLLPLLMAREPEDEDIIVSQDKKGASPLGPPS